MGWKLAPTPFAWTNIKEKTRFLAKVHDSEDELSATLSNALPASGATKYMRATGSVLWVYGKARITSEDENRKLYSQFHTFLLVYQNRQLAIIDPEVSECTVDRKRRLSDFAALHITLALVRTMRKSGKVVEKLWISTPRLSGIGLSFQDSAGIGCDSVNRRNFYGLLSYLQQSEDRTIDFTGVGWENINLN